MYNDTDPKKAVFIERFKEITGKDKVKEIAEKLNVSIDTVKKWRSPANKTLPSKEDLYKICNKYHCTHDYLFGYDESYSLQYEKITELTGLSSPSIETLCQEASELGDNRRVVILDYLLSNHELFNDLMDNILSLHQQTQFPISLKHPPKPLLDESGEWLLINRENLDKLGYKSPDDIYQNIRNILSRFIKEMPQKPISYGELHPF